MSAWRNLRPGGTNLSTSGYTYDANGLIQTWSQQNDAAAALTSSFKYDAAGQLTEASTPTGSAVKNYIYRYDRSGNRTSEQIDSGVASGVYNSGNQLTGLTPSGPIRFAGTVSEPGTVTVNGMPASVDATNAFSVDVPLSPGVQTVSVVATDPSNNTTTKNYQVTVNSGVSRTLVYDAAGNQTDDGAGRTYAWDALNRLVKITQASGVTEFVYNGAGQRVQEKFNGAIIKQWVWCDGAQPCEERDPSGNVTKRFFAQGEQIAASNYFYSTDQLGSIRELTDSSGTVRARYQYDPYGRSSKVSGGLEADFGFTGFYRHQASGLSLTLYRAYDPELGRWLSRDPIAEQGGLNLYAYVENNPIDAIDSLGLRDYYYDGSQYLYIGPAWYNPFSKGEWYAISPKGAEQILRREKMADAAAALAAIVIAKEVADKLHEDQMRRQEGDPNDPKPPGWTSEWERAPGTRKGCQDHRWWDPQGGEWRRHHQDQHHPQEHWDYNPWDHSTSPWQNRDDNDNPMP